MKRLHLHSVSEQTAAHLRDGLLEGRWRGKLPGVVALAAELGVAKATLRAALRVIEGEGLIALETGAGRSCRVICQPVLTRRRLRIGILLYEPMAQENAEILELLGVLKHALEDEGFDPFLSTQTQSGLRHDAGRIAGYVGKTPADAWVIVAGARPVLEWFAAQPAPCIAFAGRRDDLAIASVGPDKAPATAEATRCLIALGHRRILFICRKLRRVPEPGPAERAFLDELTRQRLPVSDFNLPDWEETPEGFQTLLREIFRISQPSALIVDEVPFFFATQQFLLRRGIRVPDDVSLVSTDTDPNYVWCVPSIAHLRWDYHPVIRWIVSWATNVSKGRKDLKQTTVAAEYVPGGTVATAPKASYAA